MNSKFMADGVLKVGQVRLLFRKFSRRTRRRCLGAGAAVLLVSQLYGCGAPLPEQRKLSHFDRIRAAGELRVLVRDKRFASSRPASGTVGFERDLLHGFASHLGVRLRFIPANARPVTERLLHGEADFAVMPSRSVAGDVLPAGGLPPFAGVTPVGGWVGALAGGLKGMARNSAQKFNPRMAFAEYSPRRVHTLKWAFPENAGVRGPRALAWMFAEPEGDHLAMMAEHFLRDMCERKGLDPLLDRHFGHNEGADPALDRNLRESYGRQLGKYRRTFVEAAARHGLDWRLLAAVAFQESRWDGYAVSAEGVRGMMMLTGATARELGVDRNNPGQSIHGGARYLKAVWSRLPEEIAEPDRTWFALSAYNLGPGRVETARRLAKKLGRDPNKWAEVKKTLPLVGAGRSGGRFRHPSARGKLTVQYVNRVRHYYDLLVRLSEKKRSGPSGRG
ncbi:MULTISPECIES: transglycosylase SLT domain-containing protein [unclassified Methylococcus]|jgi:membrane-bound lytic murein transglycosylase F|uniref:transglycosylase SLT domain-containing protein n=1 Tax=unclassified Methylococcus TaxID=2618889 RepID=UPI003D7D7DFE